MIKILYFDLPHKGKTRLIPNLTAPVRFQGSNESSKFQCLNSTFQEKDVLDWIGLIEFNELDLKTSKDGVKNIANS